MLFDFIVVFIGVLHFYICRHCHQNKTIYDVLDLRMMVNVSDIQRYRKVCTHLYRLSLLGFLNFQCICHLSNRFSLAKDAYCFGLADSVIQIFRIWRLIKSWTNFWNTLRLTLTWGYWQAWLGINCDSLPIPISHPSISPPTVSLYVFRHTCSSPSKLSWHL